MQPVTDYLDYRKYILDYYKEHKEQGSFSWREFSRIAGFGNPVYLKRVTEGVHNLSLQSAGRVAKGMNLVGKDLIYFKLMVLFKNAKTSQERESAFKRMQKIGRDNDSTLHSKDVLRFFSSYKNLVVRELATFIPEATPSKIAQMAIPEMSPVEVADSIGLMLKLGILEKAENGKLHQTSKVISMIEPAKQVASTKLQIAMGKLALDAMQKIPFAERNMTGLTIGISPKTYKRIVYEISEFHKKIAAIVTEDTESNQVFRLNLQLFPLSKIVK